MQLLELDAHLHPQLGIEVRQRLVEQEHAGVAHDGTAERHALALAAGELARLALQQFADAEDVGRVPHALVDLGLFEFAHFQAERHVVVHAHVRVERVVLEHHGDVAVHRRQCIDHGAVDRDIAGADRLKSGDHPERRRLAAAGRSDEHHELLVADLQIDVFDSVHAVVELVDPLEDDLSHSLPPASQWPMRILHARFPIPMIRGVSPSPIRSILRRSARRRTNRRWRPVSIPAGRLPSAVPRRTRRRGSAPM